MPKRLQTLPLDRREFCSACALSVAALACGGGGGGGSAGGGSMAPPPPSGTITTNETRASMLAQPVGTVRDYRTSDITCPGGGSYKGFWLIRDAGGIYALSAKCTHEGTRINQVGASSFGCTCHGSQYDFNGGVTRGPATVALDHFQVSEPSAGAMLVVDPSLVVGASVRLT